MHLSYVSVDLKTVQNGNFNVKTYKNALFVEKSYNINTNKTQSKIIIIFWSPKQIYLKKKFQQKIQYQYETIYQGIH